MNNQFQEARRWLDEFKGDRYISGLGCIDRAGPMAASLGRRAAVMVGGHGREWARPVIRALEQSLTAAGVEIVGELIPGARPNAPREDVLRLKDAILARSPDAVVVAGSGSSIDAVKCATVMAALDGKRTDFDDYFGVGKVSAMLAAEGKSMLPVMAVQLAASSAAHLTKYSNITDPAAAQKKLIVDDAIVPPAALFDYGVTTSQPRDLTVDGALDGIAHAIEVFYGASGETLERVRPIVLLAVDLLVQYVKRACENPDDLEAREALGLGTDLGGYVIMLGGTNGGHLTSFSMVDILSHGRACALANPYYTVFFAPAIQSQLRDLAPIFSGAGYMTSSDTKLSGRDLGVAVSEGMRALSRDIGAPTKLEEVPGFTDVHVARALAAAKHPSLEMKLRAMPIPISADTVDKCMGAILEAARTGDVAPIRRLS